MHRPVVFSTRARVARPVRATPESKQAPVKPAASSNQNGSGDGRDTERINEFSREFLPKLLDEQEGAAKSGNELSKIVQWAGELGNKAQRALADLQRSVSSLGGEPPKAEPGAGASIQDTLAKLDDVSAAIADSNTRFDAELAAGGAAAASQASADGAEKLASREAYLNDLADSLEVAEARIREEAAAAAAAVEGAASEAAAAAAAAAEGVKAAAAEVIDKVEGAIEAAVEKAEAAVAGAVEGAKEKAAGAAAGELVKVELAVRRQTSPGQDVWVVGSAPALGGWDLDKALALKWTEGHVWRATIEVDPSSVPHLEYKAVLKCADGPTIWEGGDNKTADLAPGAAETELYHEFAE